MAQKNQTCIVNTLSLRGHQTCTLLPIATTLHHNTENQCHILDQRLKFLVEASFGETDDLGPKPPHPFIPYSTIIGLNYDKNIILVINTSTSLAKFG